MAKAEGWEVSEDEDEEEEEQKEGVAEGDDNDDDDYASLAKPKKGAVVGTSATSMSTTTSTPPSTTTQPTAAPTTTLRNRKPKPTPRSEREALLSKPTGAPGEPTDAEALLDQQRLQQEDLTEEMLKMARALKESSLEFGKNLEDEKGYLDQAAEGLDKNARGMDAAGRSIENLRKNETVSYYWAIIYMATILALVFFTLVILFLAPKLRW
jgi:hypothetical protein